MSHRPRKRFGQHFLHDPAVIGRLIAAIAPRAGETIVEIGPGTGALTEPLLARAGRVHAVELDRDLASLLERRLGHRGLVLHCADALRFDFAALAAPGTSLRVVGNLPYNVSTPLLFHLLAQRDSIADMHFMLQNEVVDRMASAPGRKSYGRLSVMVQLHCRVEPLFRVGPGAFRPPPRVDSAVVRLRPRSDRELDAAQSATLEQLTARLFSRRRKTVRNGLLGLLDADAIAAAGVDPAARPETLPVAAFVSLARALHAARGDHR